MIRNTLLPAVALLAVACLLPGASAYEVMPSLNNYQKGAIENALARVGELRSDGVWFITPNSDFDDSEWRAIFASLQGRCVSEDNPNSNKSFTDYVRIAKHPPDDSMCYNETGGLPGGTLLSDDQITAQFEFHGSRPIICLTRSYGGVWRTETDRCLDNPKVGGICLEYVKKALLENINAPGAGIKAIRAKNKRVYILLHASGEGWTLDENRQIIDNLNRWCPKEMASGEVRLVYQDYSRMTQNWFGPGGVRDAIRQACEMPNYTGIANHHEGDN